MDWLAKLVALSYLLSRYLSLTILKLLLVQHFLKEAIHYQYLSTQHPSAMKYIQGFYCQYLSVVGNWDHWWTYDGISGPGISFKEDMLLNK